jgi:hypothetical protein
MFLRFFIKVATITRKRRRLAYFIIYVLFLILLLCGRQATKSFDLLEQEMLRPWPCFVQQKSVILKKEKGENQHAATLKQFNKHVKNRSLRFLHAA